MGGGGGLGVQSWPRSVPCWTTCAMANDGRNPPETRPVEHVISTRQFEEGLAEAIDKLVEDLPNHDRIQTYIASRQLRNVHRSANFTVGTWRNFLEPARQILSAISSMLNLNENVDIHDSMELDLTHRTVCSPET